MSLDAAEIDRAFQFFLNRTPPAAKRPEFASMAQLFQAVMGSTEFRTSDRAWKNGMIWPLRQVFVVPDARVIYCPIGKNGCSFLKGLMIHLSGAEGADFMMRDVHQLTDHVNTGLQLSDYPKGRARHMAGDPDFMKFAVLRDPADRLLSAWVEKFLLNRHEIGNQRHTGPVIAAVQGQKRPDFHRSISFGDFVRHVARAKKTTLDPHWRPQHLYLKGIDYTHLFRFEDLNDVVDALEAWTGASLPRQPVNTTGSASDGGVDVADAFALEPPLLDPLPRVARQCFFDADLEAMIAHAYARDYDLMETIGQTP